MNEYEKQAADFLKSCGAKMTIKQVDIVDRFPNDNGGPCGLRYKYRVRIVRKGRGSFSLNFYGSIADFQRGRAATCYDVLSCVQKYDVGTFAEFCDEYGYNSENLSEYPRIMRIYKAVKREYNNVERVFGDVMSELCEIA